MNRLARGLFAALSLAATAAGAQEPFQRPTRLPAIGRGIVGTDDTTALVQNPANLVFLPSTELRWSSIYLDEAAEVPWQGHAFALGFPLPIIPVATGLRLDLVDPPSANDHAETVFRRTYPGARLANYQWLTWGLAFGSDTAGFGFSLQRTYSESSDLHGLSSWSLGMTSRPFDHFGLAFTAHDLNAPSTDTVQLDRSYDVAAAIRPFRSRVVELGLEGKYVARDDGSWVPRATLGIDLPPLGRLRGEAAVSDPFDEERRSFFAGAVLAIHLNSPQGSTEAQAGSVFGDALGQSARYRAYNNVAVDVAFKGFREASGIEARYALRIRIESTPGAREHVAFLRKLWAIADREPKIDAIVVELRTSPAGSLAHVQELRDAFHYLRSRGKRVLCHLEDADGSSLYLCSAANRILINPAGGLRFAGLRSRYMYFKGLLDKLGIRADVVRIGAHKSAPEMFTEQGSTEVSRADKIDLLQQNERQFVEGVAQGRSIDADTLRKRIARGPFIASEAKAAGLVDGFAFDDQLEKAVSELTGRRTVLIDDKRAPRAKEHFGVVRQIGVVYVDGDMVDGRSQTIPFIGTKLVGSYTIAESLKQMREDPLVGAVVLRVETGGGSAMAADVIWREVQITARVKPVVVSMGAAAASGGYYIAAPGTRIFANPITLTGSIGIFYGKADVAELLRKIGVNIEVYKTAPRADAESIFRPYTAEERKELERKIGQFYDMFLSRVAEGRGLSKQQVDKVGQGRVWTGEQARVRGLVDELGGLRQALAYARSQAGLPDHAPIVELPPPDTSLLGRLLGIEGIKSDAAASALPLQLRELVEALAPFAVHPSDKPLARIEILPVGL
jgi:protease IV